MRNICLVFVLLTAALVLVFVLRDDDAGEALPGIPVHSEEGRQDKSEQTTLSSPGTDLREVADGGDRMREPLESEPLAAAPQTQSDDTEPSTPPLLVQVLDATGAPAIGVEVAYCIQVRGDPRRGDDRARATSVAPDGIATFEHRSEEFMLSYFEDTRQAMERIVSCRGPFFEAPALVLPDGPIEGVVQLQLEPTGGLDVEILGPTGEPIHEGVAVQLSWTRPGQKQRDGFRWLTVEDGSAKFEHIACGMELSLGASVRDSLFIGISQELLGPTKQGQRVQATLRFEATHPVLSGHLLDSKGQPVSEQRFTLELDYSEPDQDHTGSYTWRGSLHATDADGRFELPWTSAAWERAGARGVRIFRFVEAAPKGGPVPAWVPRYAEVLAPRFTKNQTLYELGEITLGQIPLLVSGQVLDEEGAPVPQVFVSVRYPSPKHGRIEWFNHRERPYTDAQGRFCIRTTLPYAEVELWAWKTRGGSSEKVKVPVGTSAVELLFLPPDPEGLRGEVKGTLLADERIPWAGLEVRLRGVGKSPGSGNYTGLPYAGGYRFRRVPPGTYGLEIVSDGRGFCGPPFVHWKEQDIVVQQGQTTTVPPIDLRSKLRLFELIVLDPDGERIDKQSCRIGNPLVSHRGGWVYGGRVVFVAPIEIDSIQLAAGEHAAVKVLWSPEPQTVQLR